MKKLSEIYKELGIDFKYPIVIKNSDGNRTYFEDSDGYRNRYEYDADGNQTYFEDSEGWHTKGKVPELSGDVLSRISSVHKGR